MDFTRFSIRSLLVLAALNASVLVLDRLIEAQDVVVLLPLATMAIVGWMTVKRELPRPAVLAIAGLLGVTALALLDAELLPTIRI